MPEFEIPSGNEFLDQDMDYESMLSFFEEALITSVDLGQNYIYGFGSHEKDDEIRGSGNSYDFGARMHDPRLGRFLSLDPKIHEYPYMSPYCYAANNPIYYLDKNGEVPVPLRTNPTIMDVWSYLSKNEGKIDKIQMLVILYHESKLNQFESNGAVEENSGDFGIAQINKSTWEGKTQLKSEGIDKVDWDKIEGDWKYNVKVGMAILSDELKKEESKNPDMTVKESFVASYARYNGGNNGYKQYLAGHIAINKHIDGKNGLIEDIDNLSKSISQDLSNAKSTLNKLNKDFNKNMKKGNVANLIHLKESIANVKKKISTLKEIQGELTNFKEKIK